MSATFKNAKRKLPQAELRKFMNEHKLKSQPTAKINSPLAKYNEAGQLMCILCQSVVRSEAVWSVHINAKQHKTNVEQAKALKEKTNNFTTAKRPISPPPEVNSKKPKGILKNSGSIKPTIAPSNIVVVENTRKIGEKHKISDPSTEKESTTHSGDDLPPDFFDSGPSSSKKSKSSQKSLQNAVQNVQAMEVDEDVPTEQIPEGFFDDPKLDAKARNIEFKDPIEEEWERFQKEIKDADYASAAIIAEDQEEATNERQIDEIEEQMKNWSRVVELEKKKVEIIQQVADIHMNVKDEDEESSTDEDIDEFLDWRSKRA